MCACHPPGHRRDHLGGDHRGLAHLGAFRNLQCSCETKILTWEIIGECTKTFSRHVWILVRSPVVIQTRRDQKRKGEPLGYLEEEKI